MKKFTAFLASLTALTVAAPFVLTTFAETIPAENGVYVSASAPGLSELVFEDSLYSELYLGESCCYYVDGYFEDLPEYYPGENPITYRVENEDVLRIDDIYDDCVTISAIAPGTSKIYAIAPDGRTAEYSITVLEDTFRFADRQADGWVEEIGSVATIGGEDVTFTVSDDTIIELIDTEDGVATFRGLRGGQVLITATDGKTGETASILVQVHGYVETDFSDFHFTSTVSTVQTGEIGELHICGEQAAEFSIENSEILEIISTDGGRLVFRGLTPGEAIVTATSPYEGSIATAYIEVIDPATTTTIVTQPVFDDPAVTTTTRNDSDYGYDTTTLTTTLSGRETYYTNTTAILVDYPEGNIKFDKNNISIEKGDELTLTVQGYEDDNTYEPGESPLKFWLLDNYSADIVRVQGLSVTIKAWEEGGVYVHAQTPDGRIALAWIGVIPKSEPRTTSPDDVPVCTTTSTFVITDVIGGTDHDFIETSITEPYYIGTTASGLTTAPVDQGTTTNTTDVTYGTDHCYIDTSTTDPYYIGTTTYTTIAYDVDGTGGTTTNTTDVTYHDCIESSTTDPYYIGTTASGLTTAPVDQGTTTAPAETGIAAPTEDLPQTGNNDLTGLLVLLGTCAVTGTGYYALKRSGLFTDEK